MDEEVKIGGNIDLNQALKEFEAKSQAEQIPQAPEISKTSEVPKMVQLMMKWFGLEQKQAEYILLGFVVVAIGISLYLFFGVGSRSNTSLPLGSKIIYPANQPPRLEYPLTLPK